MRLFWPQLALAAGGLNARQAPWAQMGYLHHPGSEDEVKGISHWVVANFDSRVSAPRCASRSNVHSPLCIMPCRKAPWKNSLNAC